MDVVSSVETLKEIKSILDEENLTFWLEAGTLLGAVRDKKIIPWDNDVDLGAFKKDLSESKVRKLAKIFDKKGFIVHFFPEKIDLNKNGLTIQIHLIFNNLKKDNFTWKRVGNKNKFGNALLYLYRMSQASYYGRFKFDLKNNARFHMKTNLFKILSGFPLLIRDKMGRFFLMNISKLGSSGVYYLNIPESYLRKFNKIKFYGMDFNVPGLYEEYLTKEYGNWRKPPKNPGSWVWHKAGNWKKIYNKKDVYI